MMRTSELQEMAREWGLKFITIRDLQDLPQAPRKPGGPGGRDQAAHQIR